MTPASFGSLLRATRHARHVTQHALAAPLDIHGSYIARLERDERHPSRHVVLGLAAVLACDAEARDRLLAAAGHLPIADEERLSTLGADMLISPALVAVRDALQDKELSPASREALGESIVGYVGFRVSQIKREA